MDNLDLAFLATFRSSPRIARRIMRYGVVRFRRQLRQAARISDYEVSGLDRVRVLGDIDNLLSDVLALAAVLHSPRKVNP